VVYFKNLLNFPCNGHRLSCVNPSLKYSQWTTFGKCFIGLFIYFFGFLSPIYRSLEDKTQKHTKSPWTKFPQILNHANCHMVGGKHVFLIAFIELERKASWQWMTSSKNFSNYSRIETAKASLMLMLISTLSCCPCWIHQALFNSEEQKYGRPV